MVESEIEAIIESMKEFIDDASVPKNIKIKITDIIEELESDQDLSLKINKALQELEEISNDSNLQSFSRTQIWNLISLLESV